MNTWPDGIRKPMTQSEHERWNASNYPGTRQICVDCDCPTDRCEEDELSVDDIGPLCIDCYQTRANP